MEAGWTSVDQAHARTRSSLLLGTIAITPYREQIRKALASDWLLDEVNSRKQAAAPPR